VARGKVAAEIRKLRLDEIFVIDEDERVRMERSALLDIIDRAKPEAIEAARNWGVNVLSVAIGHIEMPEEAQQEFLRRWGAPWRGWRDLIEAEAKRQVAIAEARGEQEAIKLRADAKRWRVIGEALAELEAASHKADRDLLVAQTQEAIAQAKGKATVMNAEARAKATEIEADAEGRAEAQRIEQLARALVRALGPQGAKEILKEMAKQKVSLAQMRRLLGVINLSRRALEGGPGMGSSEEDEMTQE
jgi:regulator of protease activity HflC (stomatin/prohibitin superfamily)